MECVSTGQSLYVALEGVDGAGKDTVARMLTDESTPGFFSGWNLISEPGGGMVGEVALEAMRAASKTGDKADHKYAAATMAIARGIAADQTKSAAKDGRSTLSVRSFMSSLVYQGVNDEMTRVVRTLNAEVEKPGLYIVLDLPGALATSRVKTRGGDIEEFERDAARLDALRLSYFDAAAHCGPCFFVDASRSPLEVTGDIMRHMSKIPEYLLKSPDQNIAMIRQEVVRRFGWRYHLVVWWLVEQQLAVPQTYRLEPWHSIVGVESFRVNLSKAVPVDEALKIHDGNYKKLLSRPGGEG